MESTSVSLNKYISDTGYCSRREADRLIDAGRVLLNNRTARTGSRYKEGDEVVVDGSILKPAKKDKLVYIAFNKPVGITTTSEQHVKGNIISYINFPKRIFPIGRLDKDSSGLIFLTNDGDIVNRILRAGNQHEKEYIVRINKAVEPAFLRSMSEGVRLEDATTLPCKVQQAGRQSFRITLTQGLNRQIRRMCEALGYEVTDLQRVRIMNVKLDKLAVGKWRYLSQPEIDTIMASVAHSDPSAAASIVKAPAAKKPRKEVDKPFAPVLKSPAPKTVAPKKPAPATKPEERPAKKSKSGSFKEFRRKGRSR